MGQAKVIHGINFALDVFALYFAAADRCMNAVIVARAEIEDKPVPVLVLLQMGRMV